MLSSFRSSHYNVAFRYDVASSGEYPDRFAAIASFHGGNLATDAPTSPHLSAPKLKAELYIAAAENDRSYPPEMAERLENTLAQSGVRYLTETFSAAHGWIEMLALFARNLRHLG